MRSALGQRYSGDIMCCIQMSQRKTAELSPACVSAKHAEVSFEVSNVKKGLEQPKLCAVGDARP